MCRFFLRHITLSSVSCHVKNYLISTFISGLSSFTHLLYVLWMRET